MKLKSIVGREQGIGLNIQSKECNVLISHIVSYNKYNERKTLIGTTSKEKFIVNITLSEFKKLLEE